MQDNNDDYATMMKLMEVALPRDAVHEMKKNIETLLVKYSDEIHMITVHDLKKHLGL